MILDVEFSVSLVVAITTIVVPIVIAVVKSSRSVLAKVELVLWKDVFLVDDLSWAIVLPEDWVMENFFLGKSSTFDVLTVIGFSYRAGWSLLSIITSIELEAVLKGHGLWLFPLVLPAARRRRLSGKIARLPDTGVRKTRSARRFPHDGR